MKFAISSRLVPDAQFRMRSLRWVHESWSGHGSAVSHCPQPNAQRGGFSLACPAAEIPFSDILNAVDVFSTDGRRAFGWGNCDQLSPCPLHDAWSRLSHQIRDWANDTYLAEAATAAEGDQRIKLFPDFG